MMPARLDRYLDVLRRRPRDVRVAVEKPDRLVDRRIRRPYPEAAIWRPRYDFALDWISPSFTSESMQALISACAEAPRS